MKLKVRFFIGKKGVDFTGIGTKETLVKSFLLFVEETLRKELEGKDEDSILLR
jgi:hypothetical protein